MFFLVVRCCSFGCGFSLPQFFFGRGGVRGRGVMVIVWSLFEDMLFCDEQGLAVLLLFCDSLLGLKKVVFIFPSFFFLTSNIQIPDG